MSDDTFTANVNEGIVTVTRLAARRERTRLSA